MKYISKNFPFQELCTPSLEAIYRLVYVDHAYLIYNEARQIHLGICIGHILEASLVGIHSCHRCNNRIFDMALENVVIDSISKMIICVCIAIKILKVITYFAMGPIESRETLTQRIIVDNATWSRMHAEIITSIPFDYSFMKNQMIIKNYKNVVNILILIDKWNLQAWDNTTCPYQRFQRRGRSWRRGRWLA